MDRRAARQRGRAAQTCTNARQIVHAVVVIEARAKTTHHLELAELLVLLQLGDQPRALALGSTTRKAPSSFEEHKVLPLQNRCSETPPHAAAHRRSRIAPCRGTCRSRRRALLGELLETLRKPTSSTAFAVCSRTAAQSLSIGFAVRGQKLRRLLRRQFAQRLGRRLQAHVGPVVPIGRAASTACPAPPGARRRRRRAGASSFCAAKAR